MCRIMHRNDFLRAHADGVAVENMQTMCFCDNGRFRRWDEVRFRAERAHDMVIYDLEEFEEACKARRRYRIQSDSCYVGFLSSDIRAGNGAFMLGEDFDVTKVPADAVILLTRAFTGRSARGKAKANTYVPYANLQDVHKEKVADRVAELRYWLQVEPQSEEERRLRWIQELSSLLCGARLERRGRFQRARQHPSLDDARERFKGFVNCRGERVCWHQVPLPPPQEDYVCGVCRNYFKPLHFAEKCPAAARKDWVPMSRRHPPHGVPSCQKVAVPWTAPEAEVAAAQWLDIYGQLWRKR